MASLRILSWNVHAFRYQPTNSVILRIGAIIVRSAADIVCIEGLRVGADTVGGIGAQPSAGAQAIVRRLADYLGATDAGAGWCSAVSGVNADVTDDSRDSYAFFWKSTPSRSAGAHAQPVDAVTGVGDPVILRQLPDDNFPGRRPGMLAVVVQAGESAALLNVVAYHAGTPGHLGINALATLPEVGGGLWVSGGEYVGQGPCPLPEIDTVIVGDFKTSMGGDSAALTYQNLLSNYRGCVSTPAGCANSKYSPSATQGLALSGAPDNIFVLKDHGGFTSTFTLVPSKSPTIDFIADVPTEYGRPIAFSPATTETAWGITYRNASQDLHFRVGLSNHLPVWSDLAMDEISDTAARLHPTRSGTNGVLHAVMGTMVDGVYCDTQADSNRQRIVDVLREQQAEQGPAFFPVDVTPEDVIVLEPEPGTEQVAEVELGVDVQDGTSIDVGDAVLRGMLLAFSQDPTATALLGAVRAKRKSARGVVNPFIDQEFLAPFNVLYERYVSGICAGRPFNLEEVLLVAEVLGAVVTLWTIRDDQYNWNTFTPSLNVLPDPDQAVSATVFGDGWHFYRFG